MLYALLVGGLIGASVALIVDVMKDPEELSGRTAANIAIGFLSGLVVSWVTLNIGEI